MKWTKLAGAFVASLSLVFAATATGGESLSQQCWNFEKAQDYPRAVKAGRDAIKKNASDANALMCLGRAHKSMGDLDTALKYFLQAERLLSAKNDLSIVYSSLGAIYEDKGDLQQALNYYSRGLALARDVANKAMESAHLSNVAGIFRSRGENDKALDYYDQALSMKGVDDNKSTVFNNIAVLYDDLEQFDKALEYIDKAIAESRRFGDYHSASLSLLNKGALLTRINRFEDAAIALDEGIKGVRKVGDKNWESIGLGYLADLARAQDDVDKAKLLYRDALKLAQVAGNTDNVERYTRRLAALQREASTVDYGVLEIGSKGVKAAVVSSYIDGSGRLIYQTAFKKSLNTDVIKGVAETGEFTPEAMESTANAAVDLLALIRESAPKLGDNIVIAGSSALSGALNREDLGSLIQEKTGIKPIFINSAQELVFAMIGSLPEDYLYKSALLDIGSGNARIGYLVSPRGTRKRGQVAINIRAGSVSLADLANKSRATDENYLSALERVVKSEVAPRFAADIKQYPVLAKHKHLVVVGGAAWAMASLLYPEQQGSYVRLNFEDFNSYYERLVSKPNDLLNPDLSHIADAKVRDLASKQIESVKKTFTLENLQAGARLLKMVADQAPLAHANIFFARDGNWAYGMATGIMASERMSKD